MNKTVARISIVGEERGLDYDAYAQLGVELLIGKEAFAITIVILHEEILIVAFEEAIVELHDGVVIEFPPFALG